MPYVEAALFIQGKPGDIYDIAREMEKFPQFMPDVKSVKVVEKFDNKTVTEWVSELEDTPITWKELDEFDERAPSIKYKLLEGDLDKFEGEWRFEKKGNGTQVTITIDYDFGMPAFENIVGPVLKLKVADNAMMMLESIKKKVEGSP